MICVLMHEDRLVHKVKQCHCLGAADICCVSLVLHYFDDSPCKNYNYIFMFFKVMPKTP